MKNIIWNIIVTVLVVIAVIMDINMAKKTQLKPVIDTGVQSNTGIIVDFVRKH